MDELLQSRVEQLQEIEYRLDRIATPWRDLKRDGLAIDLVAKIDQLRLYVLRQIQVAEDEHAAF